MAKFLMRHGESLANELHVAGGDPPLTETGERQAREAWLPDGISSVRSSHLLRATQTSRIVGRRLGIIPGRELPEFDEVFFGAYDGMPVDDWFNDLYDRDIEALCAEVGGNDVETRVRLALRTLDKLPDGTLVVTSDTLLRCMEGWLAEGRIVPLGELPLIANCEVLSYEDGRLVRIGPETRGSEA